MRLRDWRKTWMWLAIGACGSTTPEWMKQPTTPPFTTAAWMKQQATPPISVFDAPPLAGAKYVATVAKGDWGRPGPHVSLEHGSFQCEKLVDLLGRDDMDQRTLEERLAEAKKTCKIEVATLLRERAGFAFVIDGQGQRWLSADQILAAALPIDSPAKAQLVIWLGGKYELGWGGGHYEYGGPEAGIVRQVEGGYEVIGRTDVTESHCEVEHARETVTDYRHTLFVDTQGAVHEREKVASHRYNVASPCRERGH